LEKKKKRETPKSSRVDLFEAAQCKKNMAGRGGAHEKMRTRKRQPPNPPVPFFSSHRTPPPQYEGKKKREAQSSQSKLHLKTVSRSPKM
jgi:hypothetical protein